MAESADAPDLSYAALFRVPGLPRILLGMLFARTAGTMATVVVVLFALSTYHSPVIAGLVTFASLAPAILVSPIAGALLDRYRRGLLVQLDYALGSAAFVVLAGLAAASLLPAELLLLVVILSALTTPLSGSGLGSLFPLIVPEPLWERANAGDSNTYVIATIVGPPVAAIVFQGFGGAVAFALVGAFYAAAAAVLTGIPDPFTRVVARAGLLRSALHGLLFTVRNASLRGLGVSISCLNVAGGILVIAIPVILVDRLQTGEFSVGIAWGVMGLAGVVSAVLAGRHDSRNRERLWLAGGMLGTAVALAVLLVPLSLAVVLLAMAGVGLFNGVIDVALFTIRQRRTPRAWMGRAFAVSVAINSTGYPIGSAISGPLVGTSVELAVAVAVVACLLGATAGVALIPARAREVAPG